MIKLETSQKQFLGNLGDFSHSNGTARLKWGGNRVYKHILEFEIKDYPEVFKVLRSGSPDMTSIISLDLDKFKEQCLHIF